MELNPFQAAGVIALSGTAVSIATFGLFTLFEEDEEDENVEVNWDLAGHNYEEEPPIPQFNKKDSLDCKRSINDYFWKALESYSFNQKYEAKLRASY